MSQADPYAPLTGAWRTARDSLVVLVVAGLLLLIATWNIADAEKPPARRPAAPNTVPLAGR